MAIWKIQLEFVVASECSFHVTAFHALDPFLVDLVLPRFAALHVLSGLPDSA